MLAVKTRSVLKTASALALMAMACGPQAWSQQAPAPAAAIPTFPTGPDYAGVAGSAAENARIGALCGANRNAKDGYFATPATPGQARAPIVSSKQAYTVQTVASLDRSIGMAFLPSGKILVSQRAGGLRTVDKAGVVSEPLAGAPTIQQARLTSSSDILLDRDFAKNRTLYYGFVARPDAAGAAPIGRLVKARLSADEKSLTDVVTLHEASDLVPRRIVQARDGTLLIASAEVASGGPNPQSMKSELGKILRLNTDGSIPRDNPFVKDAAANPALYATGFRDVQGLALEPRTKAVWLAENTPMGGDELNVIRAGGNYGFPVISYGRENSGALINGGKTVQAGMEQPVYIWTPSIAPSGLTFYDGKAFPAWRGNVFVGAMSGKQLVRLEMKNGRVVAEEKLLLDRCKRIKDVRQGPEGYLYVMTDETPSEILRIVPAR